jgi:hypothetical protein
VAALEPTFTGKQGPELRDMWHLMQLASCLVLSLYAGVHSLQGTDIGPLGHLKRGSEPLGGAISLLSCPVVLNFSPWRLKW